ncbi:MAG: hypothetical protein MZV63_62260 [Marinilabiliales bacterium]|nr:hypothetical protein [Marinilabiliales bacterium]
MQWCLRIRVSYPHMVARAPEHGLMLDYFLFCDEAFRIAPPLTISPDEIHLACQRLKGCWQQAVV